MADKILSKKEMEELAHQLDKDQFQAWLDHPVTRDLFNFLRSKRDGLKEMWAGGGFAAPSIEEMVIRDAAAQSACSILQEILTLDEVELRGSYE